MTNTYSQRWFELFLQPIDQAQTEREVAWLQSVLPQPGYSRLFDLCCGAGRHAHALARAGYQIVGMDRDEAALAAARAYAPPGATFVAGDMRDLSGLAGPFDAVLSLWQSFGYFDAATNAEILRQLARLLRSRGRLVLDIYHCTFFERNEGVREFERNGVRVAEHKQVRNGRLTVELRYGSGDARDRFEWQLYTPGEIAALAAQLGLRELHACAEWDLKQHPSADLARMQLVFEKDE